MGGQACIRGMRIPVSVIVSQLANGATAEEVLADYPDLEREDVQQALQYAALQRASEGGEGPTCHDRLSDVCGVIDGPKDLSTHHKGFTGFGE